VSARSSASAAAETDIAGRVDDGGASSEIGGNGGKSSTLRSLADTPKESSVIGTPAIMKGSPGHSSSADGRMKQNWSSSPVLLVR
jgi:hypothetical protein